jgi:hypothetical protein
MVGITGIKVADTLQKATTPWVRAQKLTHGVHTG